MSDGSELNVEEMFNEREARIADQIGDFNTAEGMARRREEAADLQPTE